ncbi:MAG TPA: acyl carrier protein [Clostridiales bacterium]|nr:acyl carrier protein [Clostridiales bacterium]
MENIIKKIVSEVSEVNEADFDENTELVDELNVDSMMALEIMTKLEKEFEITIPEDQLPKFTSVKEIGKIIMKIKCE